MQTKIELNTSMVLNCLATIYALHKLSPQEAETYLGMIWHIWRTKKEAHMGVFFDTYFACRGDFAKMESLFTLALPDGKQSEFIEVAKVHAQQMVEVFKRLEFKIDIQVVDDLPGKEATK